MAINLNVELIGDWLADNGLLKQSRMDPAKQSEIAMIKKSGVVVDGGNMAWHMREGKGPDVLRLVHIYD